MSPRDIFKPCWAAGSEITKDKKAVKKENVSGLKVFFFLRRNKNINHKRPLRMNDSQGHQIKVVGCADNEKNNDQIDAHVQIKPRFCLYRS